MNKARRKEYQRIIIELEDLILEEAEAFENLPESLQYSENGDKMQQCIDGMNNAKSELEMMED